MTLYAALALNTPTGIGLADQNRFCSLTDMHEENNDPMLSEASHTPPFP